MRFIQYYSLSTGYGTNGKRVPIPAVGCDGVSPLDGRLSLSSCIEVAHQRKRSRHVGFTIMRSVDGVRYSKAVTLVGYTSFDLPTTSEQSK